jgi:hypothetical protein
MNEELERTWKGAVMVYCNSFHAVDYFVSLHTSLNYKTGKSAL